MIFDFPPLVAVMALSVIVSAAATMPTNSSIAKPAHLNLVMMRLREPGLLNRMRESL
ncbi:MAG: hypothetical protein K2W96_07060 [Gemmataceae bacterium]|nr:hypothetical protein [Gemmataceae bacterium]